MAESEIAALAKQLAVIAKKLDAAKAREEKRSRKRTAPPEEPKTQNWKKTIHTCPKCGHSGPVDPDFGVRVVRGVVRKQSWCVTCRATTNYYNAPRKNNIGP